MFNTQLSNFTFIVVEKLTENCRVESGKDLGLNEVIQYYAIIYQMYVILTNAMRMYGIWRTQVLHFQKKV